MRTRRVRLDGDTYTIPRERGGDTPGGRKAVQGREGPRRSALRPTIPASTPQERTRGRPRPGKRQGRALSIPASGLPPYKARQAATAPPGLGPQGRPGRLRRPGLDFRQGRRSSNNARYLDRLKAAEGADFGRNRPIGARRPGAAGGAAAGVGRAKGTFSIAGASPLVLAHDQLFTG